MDKQNEEKSTIDKPLGFFEYFFLNGGFNQLHRGFFIFVFEEGEFEGQPIINEPIVEINKEEEYYVYLDTNNEEGIVYHRKIFFKDVLRSHLLNQAGITKRLIDEKIQSLNLKEKKVVFFLKDIVCSLNSLLYKVKSNLNLSTYEINSEVIYFIIDLLQKRYNLFFTKIDSSCIKEASNLFLNNKVLEVSNEETKTKEKSAPGKVKSQKTITGLNWFSNPELNTILLYGILVKNGAIPDDGDTLDNLKIAFSGIPILKPLKIKWLMAKNDVHPKPVLIRIIKQILMDKLKVIEMKRNGELAKTLTMIFIDKDGIPFKNMNVTLSAKVSPKPELLESRLINELKSAPFMISPANIP